MSASSKPSHKYLSWFTRFTALNTLFLIFAGGMVTSTESGLAVPDWPLSYGMLMPPMVGGIFYEHGHRMVATWVGFLVVLQTLWIWFVEEREWLRWLAVASLGMVITQGLLGGLTVIYLLPPAVSVSHACLAQAFYSVTIVLAYLTTPGTDEALTEESLVSPKAWIPPCVVAAAIYIQLILGATMRHLGAGLAIRDFPLAMGQIIPPMQSKEIFFHFAHRVGALVVTALVIWGTTRIQKLGPSATAARRLSLFACLIVLVQFSLGAAVVLMEKPPTLTSLHVVNGAFLLGIWILIACQIRYRCHAPKQAIDD